MAVLWHMPCGDGNRLPSAEQPITTQRGLDEALRHVEDVIAFDSEFIRRRTFYPIPALFQLATREQSFAIDALARLNWDRLASLLADPQITKVMHACGQDLEVVKLHMGVDMQGIYDTQLAYAFAAGKAQVGYASVVNETLGESVAKDVQTSQWLRRPLSAKQVRYALDDVGFLLPIWDRLQDRLKQLNRLTWFEEECGAYVASLKPISPNDYYRRIAGSKSLSPAHRDKLCALVAWRENDIRARDVPRSYSVSDKCLMQIAQLDWFTERRVREILGNDFDREKIRQLKRVYISAQSTQDRKTEFNGSQLTSPVSESFTKVAKTLQSVVKKRSKELQIESPILGSARDIESWAESYVQTGELPAAMGKWRLDLLARRFEQELNSRRGRAASQSHLPRS